MTTPIARRGIDVAAVRDHFPALSRTEDGRPIAFLDGPAGTQLPRECVDAMVDYIRTSQANHGGAFATSRASDAVVAEARAAAADFLGAPDPDEVVFGPNMTTITFALSRALARELHEGDEIVLSRMEHDANVAPWLAIAEERSLAVRWLEVNAEDCTLRLDRLESVMGPRTRLVAVGLASNAVGTANDVGRVIAAAHDYGALAFVDAVHAAPHMAIDVTALDADFLVCSPYKFFAPHLGLLYARGELLERLPAYRVRPAGDRPPGKWETGTPQLESIAGLLGTFDYLASLGRAYGGASPMSTRREALHAAMRAIADYERELVGPLLGGLRALPGARVLGITDPARFDARVPTVALTLAGHDPHEVAKHLASRAINVWDGDMYAVELMRALGLADEGVVRIGLVHYNTAEEVARVLEALEELVSG